MKSSTIAQFIAVLLVTFVCIYTIKTKDVSLGIDLKGGASLLYEYDFIYTKGEKEFSDSDKSSKLERAVTTIKKRLDPSGAQGISVKLSGEKWIEIQKPAVFHSDPKIMNKLTKEAVKKIKEKLSTPGQLSFHLEVIDPDDVRPTVSEYSEWYFPDDQGRPSVRLELWFKDGVTFAKSRFGSEAGQGWLVDVKFDGVTGQKFYELTKKVSESNRTLRTGIILDGKIITMLGSDSAIPGGGCIITGQFDQESASKLGDVLMSGSMPIKVKLAQENNVGPTLGKDSIDKSKDAILFGAIAVLIFMLIYYRLPGLIGVLALSLNIALILAIMTSTKLVLTLPGIAGLLLTVGMAVDASILIFERIREEQARGKSTSLSMHDGFDKAFVTIVDANITTIITAIILFNVGTSAVRGFAATLIIGILASMFTALFVSKVLFKVLIETNIMKNIKMMKLLSKTKIQFLSFFKIPMTLSFLLGAIGIFMFYSQGDKILDIDFKGGISNTIQLTKALSNADVRNKLEAAGYDKLQIQNIIEGTTQGDTFLKYVIRIDDEHTIFANKSNEEKLKQFSDDLIKHLALDKDSGILLQQMVGPSVAKTLVFKAIIGILASMFAILVYVRLRFAEFRYGIAACIALFHDISIAVGCFGIWSYMPTGGKVDVSVVAAILTIVGYSLNDTIVIFDRIRENRTFEKARADAAARDPNIEFTPVPLDTIINESVNQTLSRTIWTSLTTLCAVLALFLYGGAVIHSFAFIMLVGVIAGTYSSIFIASPIVSMIHRSTEKKKAIILE
ncbi:MAG: hypothetical protein COA79_14980 [Planctomycetota bacterium]|nr:MAG: hypothetical protein COA79_14980 [Planctomycetota bacterium]